MIDLDPAFRVADETEAILLKQEALDEVFEDMYDRDDKLFLKLVECYCNNKNDSQLFDMVLNLYNFAMSSPSPIEWLKEKVDVFNVSDNFSFQDSKLGQALLKDVRIELESVVSSMNIAREIVNNTPSLLSYQENINPEYEMIKGLYESSNSFEDLKRGFEDVAFGKLTTIRGCKDKIEQEEVKKIRDNAKKKIGELSNMIIQASSKKSIEDLKYLYPLMNKLSDLVIKMKEVYDKKKKERALIDFNDFEHFALDILAEKDDEGKIIPSKVAEELREKYGEILID
ncbi:MAG TPA: helicase-exonuclease AddAB subunit AddA, partial [Clostridium sp.]|nr:helicase-exonuclease AddAB subunit AddA [Clostridium sp.]